MHRFYLPDVSTTSPTLTLLDREAHHAAQVLRLRPGEHVVVLDGVGHEYGGDVREVMKKRVTIAVTERRFTPRPDYQITLTQCITKGKSMEWIVQKATELGVTRLAPVLSEHSVPQFGHDSAADKVAKWNTIAIESLKQCGSPWLPQIDPPRTLPAHLACGERHDLSLIASLSPEAGNPREFFQNFLTIYGRRARSIRVWIGPEGDFTDTEMRAVLNAGANPITLGPLVLRAETAAVCALAIVNHEMRLAVGA